MFVKAYRFFKSLLGFKTTDTPPSEPNNKKLKRRWSFGKSRRGSNIIDNCPVISLHNHSKSIDGTSLYLHNNSYKDKDPNKHAIALAAATAAAVDAAVAAAHAAVEVVRMTYGVQEELAAIKIQSCFRAYLARRALKALKALVRLQAVVRGHILRKQTVDMMRRLQVLIRAQARARAVRSQINGSITKPSHFHHHGPPTPEKINHFPHTKHDYRSISKRNGPKYYVRGVTDQERMFLDCSTERDNYKTVEVDTGESHEIAKGRKLFQPDQINFYHSHSLNTSRGSTLQPTSSSPCASSEVNYLYDPMRRGVSTPAKSDGSRSCISSFSDHPNYMANTESSRAKVRSLSAPRLRPDQLEVSNASRRYSGYKYTMSMQRSRTMRDSLAKKTYPGSCRLDRLRLSVYDIEESEYCDGYWN